MDQEIRYDELLKIGWLIMWRGGLLGFVGGFIIGFVVGFIGGMMGINPTAIFALSFMGGVICGVFALSPLLASMLLRKQFEGFRISVIRTSPSISN